MKNTYLFCRFFFQFILTVFRRGKSNQTKYNFFFSEKHLTIGTIILIRSVDFEDTKKGDMSATNNSEIFSHNDRTQTSALIWLDACVDTNKENKQAQEELRSIISYFKTFEDLNQCQQFILSILSHNRIVLIVSGQLGRKLVPEIHQFQQLSLIYVYCMNKEINEQWAKDFPKV